MDEETKPPSPVAEPEKFDVGNGHAESHFFSLSLRGLITLILVITLCGLVVYLHSDKVVDAFLIITSGAATFYYGQGTRK